MELSEEAIKVEYTEDFKSLVLEASLSNSLMETAEKFKVPPEMLSEWQRQEGIDCVLDPSLSRTLPPVSSTSAFPVSGPVPWIKADPLVKLEVGPESVPLTLANRVYSKDLINEVLCYLEDHTVTEASKHYLIPHSTVFGWARKQKTPTVSQAQDNQETYSIYSPEVKKSVLDFAETHTPTEVKNKFDVPTSTLYRWKRDQKCANRDENDNVDKKLPIEPIKKVTKMSSMSGGKYFKESNGGKKSLKSVENNWNTKDQIVQYAKRSKNYQVTARKFGVSPSQIKMWAKELREEKKLKNVMDKVSEPVKKRPRGRPRKVPLPPVASDSEDEVNMKLDNDADEERFGYVLYEGENLDAIDENPEDEENEIDEELDYDDEPEFDVEKRSSGGKRIKEYSQKIKEAAVSYGLEHGWTAAAIKYKTSSTSVSRWATYNNPKSPWKLKVIIESREIGIKEAAKKYKVAQATLESWIDNSGKFCDQFMDVGKEIDFNDQETNEAEEDVELGRCDVCEKELSRDETMIEHLASKHLDDLGNCDVCGVCVEDFECHFRLHMVRDGEAGDTVRVDETEKRVTSDDITDEDVQDLLKDLLVDV